MALISCLLSLDKSQQEIIPRQKAAAMASMSMPKLEVMELWNLGGGKLTSLLTAIGTEKPSSRREAHGRMTPF